MLLAPAALALLVATPQGQTASDDTELVRRAREHVVARFERAAPPSLTVAISRDGETLWEEAFGLADIASKRPATTSTPYPVGSLTKSITATGVLALVERGKVELEAPIGRYLRDEVRVFEGRAEDVTVERVLRHEAGIPHGWQVYPLEAEAPSSIAWAREHALVAFPPRTGSFRYSNYGYGVAERVIEAASGASYAEFMQAHVFDPLGMSDGGPVVTKELAARCASDGSASGASRFLPTGSAGAFASVRDLMRYASFHMGLLEVDAAPFGDALRDRMHPGADGAADVSPISFGGSRFASGQRWSITNGRIGGACSNLLLLPDEGVAICVLANISSQIADELAVELADLVVPGFRAEFGAFVGEFEAEHGIPAWNDGAVTAGWTGTWSGRIATSVRDVPFTLSVEEGACYLTWDDAYEGQLATMRGDDTRMTGGFSAALPNSSGFEGSQSIDLELVRVGDRVFGSATGSFRHTGASFSLPAYVGLERDD